MRCNQDQFASSSEGERPGSYNPGSAATGTSSRRFGLTIEPPGVTILDPRCFQNHVRMRCPAPQHTTAVSAAATTAKEETIRDMARSPGICYSGISRATGKLLNPLRERRVAELLRVRCELGGRAIRVPAGGDFARRMCPDRARRPMAAACGPPTADHHE
jgi:hypothetical protein